MSSSQIIAVSGSIIINRDASSVFRFFADPANDHLWRSEISRVIVHGKLQRGVKTSEYSRLSPSLPDHLLRFECVKFKQVSAAVFETIPGSQFYQRSEREVLPLSAMRTKVIYSLDFDRSIVKFALGFPLPVFIIKWKAQRDARKYLEQLRRELEISVV